MPDVILASDDLTVLGGPATVNVEVDFGKQGQRGSIIYSGPGKPGPDTLGSVTLQLYDMYLNTNSLDSEYGFMYQYTVTDGSTTPYWKKLLNIASVS